MTTVTYDEVRAVLGETVSEVSDSDLDPWKGIAEGVVTDQLDPHATLPGDQDALDDVAALLAAAYYSQEGTVGQLSQGSQQLSFKDGNFSYWRMATQRDPTDRLFQLDLNENTSRYTGSALANADTGED